MGVITENDDEEQSEMVKIQNIMNTFKDYQVSLVLTPEAVQNILDAEDHIRDLTIAEAEKEAESRDDALNCSDNNIDAS